jgi:tRNA-(ms[2]io[6]A)-hydroxylase
MRRPDDEAGRPVPARGRGILRSATDPRWLPLAIARFDEVLVDHAHCEKKAAASAMALVSAHPDVPVLVSRLARLAQEELRHFRQVHELIVARGLRLGRDPGDPYAQELLALVRTGAVSRRTDRLLVSSLIEARSCERLSLLAQGLPDPALSAFYARLSRAESGHATLFLDLAHDADPHAGARLAELAGAEAAIVAALPLAPRIH